MSTFNRSLAFEEIKEFEDNLVDLLPLRYLSIRNASADVQQPASQVVKISGNITVSF